MTQRSFRPSKPGYQLDTTVDKGLRTIGFKVADPCGNTMARYGATELVRDTWYHVAGVYDADKRDAECVSERTFGLRFPPRSQWPLHNRRPASLSAWVDGRISEGLNLPA